MKTIWFVLMLSVAAALEMQAQVALHLATNIFGLETSPSASNDVHQSERFRSTVFGLVYFSPDWKQSAMITELKSTEGELLSGNRERRAGL